MIEDMTSAICHRRLEQYTSTTSKSLVSMVDPQIVSASRTFVRTGPLGVTGNCLGDAQSSCLLALFLRHRVPLPLGSLFLRHLASFQESLQVVTSPRCPRQLPDVSAERLSCDAGSLPRRYTVCLRLFLPLCHRPS